LIKNALGALVVGLEESGLSAAFGHAYKYEEGIRESWSRCGQLTTDLYQPGLIEAERIVEVWEELGSQVLATTAFLWCREVLITAGG